MRFITHHRASKVEDSWVAQVLFQMYTYRTSLLSILITFQLVVVPESRPQKNANDRTYNEINTQNRLQSLE